MKRGTAFTPDGPLTLGDLREIVNYHYGKDIAGCYGSNTADDRLVEVRTPVQGDRRQVTLTVTDERYAPPTDSEADQDEDNTEGERTP